MGILQRIWSKEPAPSSLDFSLAERLKQISERSQSEQPAQDAGAPSGTANPAPSLAEAQASESIAIVEMNSETGSETALDAQPGEEEKSAPAATVADPRGTAGEEAVTMESPSETPADPEAAPIEACEPLAVEVASDPENAPQEETECPPAIAAELSNDESDSGMGFFRPPAADSQPEDQADGNLAEEIRPVLDQSADIEEEDTPLAPASTSEESILSLLEMFKVAVDQAEARGKSTLASVQQALAELQAAKQEFEAEITDRLDIAIAEYERRLTSEALVEDAAGQFEQRTKHAADKIFGEVKEQAWGMLNAVGGELRAFRDQFGKEIQGRVDLLDETTRQAVQVNQKLEETIPLANDILQSLPLVGAETAARVQAASAAIAEQLQSSRQTLSQEIENQKKAFKTLLQECHQEEEHLKEEIEKFRVETGAASDVLGRLTNESIDRLNSEANEAHMRLRTHVENLAGEMEQRLLPGDLVEKASAQVEAAAQAVVEPALERVRNAGVEADATAGTLTVAGQEVAGRLGAATAKIESQLDALMGEQQTALESSMSGFHRNAAEELGNVVERVLAQSTQQLDERLRSLFDELLSSTSEQISGTTRATLGAFHHGLRGVFESEPAEGVMADSVLLSHTN